MVDFVIRRVTSFVPEAAFEVLLLLELFFDPRIGLPSGCPSFSLCVAGHESLSDELDATPEVDDVSETIVLEFDDVVDFLLDDRLTLVNPLKHRDNSAAALFVKLTFADIPAPVEPVALFQAARNTTSKQARTAGRLTSVTCEG